MRLKLTVPKNSPHKELVGAVGWNVWNELFSCSDDHTVQRWNMHGDLDGKVRLRLIPYSN